MKDDRENEETQLGKVIVGYVRGGSKWDGKIMGICTTRFGMGVTRKEVN